MGQASDFLLGPMPREAEHLDEETSLRDSVAEETYTDTFTENSPTDVLEAHTANSNSGITSPELQTPDGPGAEGVLEDAFSGPSVFQGLSQLVHSLLVLGALHARNTFEDGHEDENDDFVAPSQSSDQPNSGDDETPNGVSALGGSDPITVSEDPHNGDVFFMAAEFFRQEDEEVAFDSLGASDGSGSQQALQSPSHNEDAQISTLSSHIVVAEPLLEDSRTYAEPENRIDEVPLSDTLEEKPNQGKRSESTSGVEPLFQSFSRPSVAIMAEATDEGQSIDFEDLGNLASVEGTAFLGHEEVRSDRSSNSSTTEPDGSTSGKSAGSKWLKTARKIVVGKLYRKRSPQDSPEEEGNGIHDPPIRNVTAAQKPTIVRNLIRRVSHQPSVVGDAESDGSSLGDMDCRLTEDALAPFNKLE